VAHVTRWVSWVSHPIHFTNASAHHSYTRPRIRWPLNFKEKVMSQCTRRLCAPTETRTNPTRRTAGSRVLSRHVGDGISQRLGVAFKHQCWRTTSQTLAGRVTKPRKSLCKWGGGRAFRLHPSVLLCLLDRTSYHETSPAARSIDVTVGN
jgi:hypothetical protein